MMVRTTLVLALAPLLLASCTNECNDIGFPSGVGLVADDYEAVPQGASVHVCTAGSCQSAEIAGGRMFVHLPVEPGDEVEFVVSVRDAASREVARSEVTARPTGHHDDDICGPDDAGQVTLELDEAGKARAGGR